MFARARSWLDDRLGLSTLTEFASLRYPGWVERSEADFGMMMAELLARRRRSGVRPKVL